MPFTQDQLDDIVSKVSDGEEGWSDIGSSPFVVAKPLRGTRFSSGRDKMVVSRLVGNFGAGNIWEMT